MSQQTTPGGNITMADMEEHFSAFATMYEKQTGGVTREIASRGLAMLPPITSSSVIHDNACGPGVVTKLILKDAAAKGEAPPKIEATDFAKGMIDYLQNEISKNGWSSVHAQIRDAADLGCFEDGTFSHSVTNFGLFALPDAVKGAKEIRRTLKDGGVALVTVWKVMDNIAIIHGAQKAIRPDLPLFNPASPDWMEEWKLKGVMAEAGFGKVEMHALENWWNFKGEKGIRELFENPFWDMARKGWTEEEKGRWVEECLKQLTETQRKEGRVRADAWACVATK
jgi:ubiquinone/menaquinone biosynthesis C-methylase UbiE